MNWDEVVQRCKELNTEFCFTKWKNNKTQKDYMILEFEIDSETLEPRVAYVPADEITGSIIVSRPYSLFLEKFTKVD